MLLLFKTVGHSQTESSWFHSHSRSDSRAPSLQATQEGEPTRKFRREGTTSVSQLASSISASSRPLLGNCPICSPTPMISIVRGAPLQSSYSGSLPCQDSG